MYETTKNHKNGKGGRENNMTSVNRKDFVEGIELKLGLDVQVGKFDRKNDISQVWI